MTNGRFRGRLGSHQGFAAVKLDDGSLPESGHAMAGREVAYVAACTLRTADHGAHWYGPTEYPLTEAGERAAVDEWEQLHARHLLTAPDDPATTREIETLLTQLGRLTIESPVAMLAGLRAVQREAEALLWIAVAHAYATGATWATIATALEMTEHAARCRYGDPGQDPPAAS